MQMLAKVLKSKKCNFCYLKNILRTPQHENVAPNGLQISIIIVILPCYKSISACVVAILAVEKF
jgi:hypothetical protein